MNQAQHTANQHTAFIAPRMQITPAEFVHVVFNSAYPHLRALSEDSCSTKGAITCEEESSDDSGEEER
jgi:hypothetical protein